VILEAVSCRPVTRPAAPPGNVAIEVMGPDPSLHGGGASVAGQGHDDALVLQFDGPEVHLCLPGALPAAFPFPVGAGGVDDQGPAAERRSPIRARPGTLPGAGRCSP
jgi:hypothetical protein